MKKFSDNQRSQPLNNLVRKNGVLGSRCSKDKSLYNQISFTSQMVPPMGWLGNEIKLSKHFLKAFNLTCLLLSSVCLQSGVQQKKSSKTKEIMDSYH